MGNHQIEPRKKKLLADDIHWNCKKADSYDKTFNICVSARGTAKTTKICRKIWKQYEHYHNHALILRRRPIDITPGYINSIAITINNFLPCHKRISLYYSKGDLSQGQADVYLDKQRTKLFFRVQALSIPSDRAKSNIIPDVSLIIYDECIPNKVNLYLQDEVTRFLDVYGTYSREFKKYNFNKTTKCWFLGNPYTLFNPFFAYLKIPLDQVKPGSFIVGKNYVFDFPAISSELRAFILKSNPTLQQDDEYVNYALNGIAINDIKYKVDDKKPFDYRLKYVFRIGGIYLLCWKDNMNVNVLRDKWYIESSQEEPTTTKTIYAIDFDNLIQNTNLINRDVRLIIFGLKEAIARRAVTYSSVTAGVLIENLYKAI